MAMCDSVTVSMAALMIGMLRAILREIWVCVLAVRGYDFRTRRNQENIVESESFGNGKMDHEISGSLILG